MATPLASVRRSCLLSRTVRFAIGLAPEPSGDGPNEARPDLHHNSFASLPSMRGLGIFGEMVASVAGQPDPVTGYLMNISAIDQAVRTHVVPLVAQAVQSKTPSDPAAILRAALQTLREAMPNDRGTLHSLRWNLTPYYSLEMHVSAPNRVLLRQSFEFAAAHRLHCDQLDAETNRAIFGKCNNPSGHGHNYRIEAAVDVALEADGCAKFSLQDLERIVADTVIRRFDHKHLNLDTTEFAEVNPSVENIARASHDLLKEPIDRAGARLACVTVWETEKTSCTYPAPG